MKPEEDDGSSNSGGSRVDLNDDGEAIGTQNNARLALMNQIGDNLDEARAEELIEFDEDGQVTQFVPHEHDEDLTPSDDGGVTQEELDRMEQEASSDGDSEEGEQQQAASEPKFKIKVNGSELELSESELIERAQKVAAADTYLATAAKIKRDAEETARRNTKTQETSEEEPDSSRIDMRELARAIQMGTEEEAIEALAKLQSRPSVTADDMTRTVDERLAFKEAAKRFESEFGDVLKDPKLKQMVIDEDLRLLKAGDTREYYERFANIGAQVRTWRDSLVKEFAPKPPVVDPEKQTRKAAAKTVPKAASRKSPAPVVEDDRDESASSVIASMAKSRGGPQWMRS